MLAFSTSVKWAFGRTTPVEEPPREIHLPVEIHCEILQYLQGINKKELASYALVCKIWSQEIGVMLYRTLTIKCEGGVEPLSDLIAHLDRYDSTGRIVRELNLHGHHDRYSGLYPTVLSCEELFAVVDRLPNLTTLTLSSMSIISDPFAIYNASRKLSFLRLEHLSAFGIGSNPYQLLHLFNSVSELQMCNVKPQSIGSQHPRPHHLPYHEVAVKKLRILLPFAGYVDLVQVVPTFRGVKSLRVRNVHHQYVGLLGKVCIDNHTTMNHLEMTLSHRGSGE